MLLSSCGAKAAKARPAFTSQEESNIELGLIFPGPVNHRERGSFRRGINYFAISRTQHLWGNNSDSVQVRGTEIPV